MDKRQYYLGIVGGGTKTQAVIADLEGQVIASVVGEPSNSFNRSPQDSFYTVMDLVLKVHELAREKLSFSIPVERTCLGLAGLNIEANYDAYHQAILKSSNLALFGHQLILVNDVYIGFLSGSHAGFGVCIIAGTGAHVYGFSDTGSNWSAGDWGYLLGDQHSGFALGQQIVSRVMAEYDGRYPVSILTPSVLEFLKLSSPKDVVAWLSAQPQPVGALASVTKILNLPQVASDPFCRDLVQGSVSDLLDAYRAVVTKLNFSARPAFEAVLIGGLLKIKTYSDLVNRQLISLTPQAQIILPSEKPVTGAVYLARHFTPAFKLPEASQVIPLN